MAKERLGLDCWECGRNIWIVTIYRDPLSLDIICEYCGNEASVNEYGEVYFATAYLYDRQPEPVGYYGTTKDDQPKTHYKSYAEIPLPDWVVPVED